VLVPTALMATTSEMKGQARLLKLGKSTRRLSKCVYIFRWLMLYLKYGLSYSPRNPYPRRVNWDTRQAMSGRRTVWTRESYGWIVEVCFWRYGMLFVLQYFRQLRRRRRGKQDCWSCENQYDNDDDAQVRVWIVHGFVWILDAK
jgi:hypothetical protein